MVGEVWEVQQAWEWRIEREGQWFSVVHLRRGSGGWEEGGRMSLPVSLAVAQDTGAS